MTKSCSLRYPVSRIPYPVASISVSVSVSKDSVLRSAWAASSQNNFNIIHLNLFVLILKSVSHKHSIHASPAMHAHRNTSGRRRWRWRWRSDSSDSQKIQRCSRRYSIRSMAHTLYTCASCLCTSVIIQSVVSIARRSLKHSIYFYPCHIIIIIFFNCNTWGQGLYIVLSS